MRLFTLQSNRTGVPEPGWKLLVEFCFLFMIVRLSTRSRVLLSWVGPARCPPPLVIISYWLLVSLTAPSGDSRCCFGPMGGQGAARDVDSRLTWCRKNQTQKIYCAMGKKRPRWKSDDLKRMERYRLEWEEAKWVEPLKQSSWDHRLFQTLCLLWKNDPRSPLSFGAKFTHHWCGFQSGMKLFNIKLHVPINNVLLGHRHQMKYTCHGAYLLPVQCNWDLESNPIYN